MCCNITTRGLSRMCDQSSPGFAPGGADDFRESRARSDRVSKPPALNISTAATFGAHETAFGKFRKRTPHGVTVDAKSVRNFNFARQTLAARMRASHDRLFEIVRDAAP